MVQFNFNYYKLFNEADKYLLNLMIFLGGEIVGSLRLHYEWSKKNNIDIPFRDVDIVFKNEASYEEAKKILLKEGYKISFSERVGPYGKAKQRTVFQNNTVNFDLILSDEVKPLRWQWENWVAKHPETAIEIFNKIWQKGEELKFPF